MLGIWKNLFNILVLIIFEFRSFIEPKLIKIINLEIELLIHSYKTLTGNMLSQREKSFILVYQIKSVFTTLFGLNSFFY